MIIRVHEREYNEFIYIKCLLYNGTGKKFLNINTFAIQCKMDIIPLKLISIKNQQNQISPKYTIVHF
jgi:hypothetical protein